MKNLIENILNKFGYFSKKDIRKSYSTLQHFMAIRIINNISLEDGKKEVGIIPLEHFDTWFNN